MLEDRAEFRRRARLHLNTARENAENIREVQKQKPQGTRARLEHLKKLQYMRISRITALELAASYLYKD
jgi:hypothetical protein